MEGWEAQLQETNRRLEGKAELAQLEALRAELAAMVERCVKAELGRVHRAESKPEELNGDREARAWPPPSPSKPEELNGDMEASQGNAGAVRVELPPQDSRASADDIKDVREYALQESAWDSLLICGLLTYPAETVMILVGCLLNLLIQITYCIVIASSLAIPVITEQKLKDIAIWRMVIAHDATNFDSLTGTSLADRVCNAKGYSITSTSQETLHTQLVNYDPALCAISIFFWLMIALSDLAGTFDFARGICSLPVGPHSKIERSAEGAIAFHSISKGRLFLVGSFLAVKVAIAITMGYLGATYLIYTKSVADLLLNAIALQFVMDTDENLFNEIVPLRVGGVIKSLTPLTISSRFRPAPRFKKIPVRAMVFFFIAIILVFVSYMALLKDELDLNIRAKALLCGADTQFVYAVDRSTGTVNQADVQSVGAVFSSYSFRSVLQRTGLDPSLLDELQAPGEERLYLSPGLAQVEELDRYTFQEASDLLPCSNLVPGIMTDEFGDPAYADAFHEHGLEFDGEEWNNCSRLNGTICDPVSRSFCPTTCGCDDPNSGLYNRTGCSSTCDLKQESTFKAQMSWQLTQGFCVDAYAAFSDANLGVFYEHFFTEVQELLESQGALVTYPDEGEGFSYLSNDSVLLLGAVTSFEFFVRFQNISLGAWARESFDRSLSQNETYVCGMVTFAYKVFGLDLCDTDGQTIFQGRVGSIRSICLRTCGYCSEGRTWPYKAEPYSSLKKWLDRSLTIPVLEDLNVTQGEHCAVYWQFPDVRRRIPACTNAYHA